MMMTEVTPHDLGIRSDKFRKFRPDQLQTATKIVASRERFIVLSAPPGRGKTLIYAVCMELLEARSLVSTVSKSLQTQLLNDFPSCSSIMGMGNYPCNRDGDMCDTGSCHLGSECEHRDGGCLFYDPLREAQTNKMVVTNYAFRATGASLGNFDFLVLDEADRILDVMTSLIGITLDMRRLRRYDSAPNLSDSVKVWHKWIHATLVPKLTLDMMRQERREKLNTARIVRKLRNFLDMFGIEKNAERNWRVTDVDGYGVDNKYGTGPASFVKLSPVWPGEYLEGVLYKGVEKVLFVSATVTRESMRYLGVENFEFIELGSLFEARRRPFIYVKSSYRIDYRLSDAKLETIVREKFDKVIRDRLDRKMIIHSRSFRWAGRIMQASRYKDIMIVNTSCNTIDVIREFKRCEPPRILVSPSVESGEDFPDESCRVQIILKVPYPDRRSDIMQARCNRMFSVALVIKSIIQMYGRSTRRTTDWSETFIFDRNWDDFYLKNKLYFASYFTEAYIKTGKMPFPLTGDDHGKKKRKRIRP